MNDELDFSSRHFQLTQLATGVYAAIARRETGGETANAAFVDMGRDVLVFDTFLLTQAARDLRRAVQVFLGKPVRYVVNSHFHADHVFGNIVFPAEATIVATAGTRALLASRGQAYLDQLKTQAPAHLERLRRQHDETTNEELRQSLSAQLTLHSTLLQELSAVSLRLPTLTSNSQAVIHGSHRTVHFLSFGAGHTDSDGFLFLPDDGILFAGDLLVKDTHPFMGDGHLDHWPIVLEEMLALDFSIAVPGHGPLATKADFVTLATYFDDLVDLAAHVVASGSDEEAATTAVVPVAYRDWHGGSFPDNMRQVYQTLLGPEEEE